MFAYTNLANPDVSSWDTAVVTNMFGIFSAATSANPNTSSWDTSLVTDMSYMFYQATSANPNNSSWNTAAVTNMSYMFSGATAFDQDIGSWDVISLSYATNMFSGVTLSTANYDSLLVGWDAQVLQSGVSFHGGNSSYCSLAASMARANMAASDFWTITDGGQTCSPGTCNVNTVIGVTEYSDITHEACEILVLGPDFIAADDSTVSVSSGWEIWFEPGFTVEQGATFDANVCGQSLCMTSPYPMPYGCHSCVDQICEIDPSCCALEFDQECLDRVDTDCGLVCE
jgi:surface protein